MFTRCEHCGIELHAGNICWLCELEQSKTKEVYVHIGIDGKIIAWQSFGNDLCPIKLNVKSFVRIVKLQYRED